MEKQIIPTKESFEKRLENLSHFKQLRKVDTQSPFSLINIDLFPPLIEDKKIKEVIERLIEKSF